MANRGAVSGVLTRSSVRVDDAVDIVRASPRLEVVASESALRCVVVFDRAAQRAGRPSRSIGDREADAESM